MEKIHLKKGEKVIFTRCAFNHPIHLTLGKIYTLEKNSDITIQTWIASDIGLVGGYFSSSYRFESLKENRKRKLFKILDTL